MMSAGIIILITILVLVLILTNIGTIFYIYKIKKSSSEPSKESPNVPEKELQIVKFIKENMSSYGDYCQGDQRYPDTVPVIKFLDNNKIKLTFDPHEIYNGKIISKNDTQIVTEGVMLARDKEIDIKFIFTLEDNKLYSEPTVEGKPQQKRELPILCK